MPAFVVCLAARLLFFAWFGERLTAYGYEHGFALQALSLMDGQGLRVIDDHVRLVDDQQFRALPRLLQPWQYPPPPAGAYAYYHATDMPGYPWILAAVWFFASPPTFWTVKLIQALASSLLVFPVWNIGHRLFGERAGVFSGWLYAVWLPGAFLAQMASKEAWEAVFAVLTAWFVLRYLQEGGRGSLLLASLSLVCATFMRTNLMVLTGGLCMVGLLSFPLRRVAICFGVTYLFLAACLVPWVLRNKEWVGREVGIKEGFYWGIAGGLALNDRALAAKVGRLETSRRNADGAPRGLFREPPEMRRLVLDVLRQRPGWYAGLIGGRILAAPWLPMEWGYDLLGREAQSYRAYHLMTGRGRLAYLLEHPFAFAFKFGARAFETLVGILSLAAFWVRRAQWRRLVWVAAGYWVFIAVYAPIHLEFRYLGPHTWALLVLAAACLANLLPGRHDARPPFS